MSRWGGGGGGGGGGMNDNHVSLPNVAAAVYAWKPKSILWSLAMLIASYAVLSIERPSRLLLVMWLAHSNYPFCNLIGSIQIPLEVHEK